MGCDIHMYVEYISIARKQQSLEKNEQPYWYCFGQKFNPGRDYDLFGVLASGVRSDYNGFSRKGMPEDAGYMSSSDNRCYIVSDDSNESSGEYCKASSAAQWVKSGASKYINDSEGKPTWVTHPDWHSHSWLSIAEFDKALKFIKRKRGYEPLEYRALLASMKALSCKGKNDVRVVFWFDN